MTYKTIVIGYTPQAKECGRCHEGHNDDRHGLYRTWAGRSAAAGLTFSVTNSDKAIVLFHVPNAVQLGDVIQEEIDDGRFRGALRRSGNRCAEEE
mgnify:CR=1 FL=1